jgi:hypothetical protein
MEFLFLSIPPRNFNRPARISKWAFSRTSLGEMTHVEMSLAMETQNLQVGEIAAARAVM